MLEHIAHLHIWECNLVSLMPRPSYIIKRGEGLGDNPNRKCPEGMLWACNNSMVIRLLRFGAHVHQIIHII